MVHNELFQQCLKAIPEEQKAEFDLTYGIAERLYEILRLRGITTRDLAKRMNKRESEIAEWLTGRHNFSMRTIARIEDALQCKLITIAH